MITFLPNDEKNRLASFFIKKKNYKKKQFIHSFVIPPSAYQMFYLKYNPCNWYHAYAVPKTKPKNKNNSIND